MPSSYAITHNPVGEVAADHPGLIRFARVGWFAKGVVYVIAGVLALLIAAKASGWSASSTPDEEASPTGALKTVAHATGGALLMWLLAIGMLIYAAWRVMSAFLPGGSDAKSWIKRIGYLVSAVIYVTFAFTAIALARNTTSATAEADGNAKVTTMSGRMMQHSGGRLLVGVVGVIIVAAGIYRLVKGARLDVDDELDLSGMSPARRTWTTRLGAVGEVGRGVGIGLVGFFVFRAALTYDASQATGLDGALRRLAAETWGLLVVLLVGVGFAAYGVFCVVTFTRRRLQAP